MPTAVSQGRAGFIFVTSFANNTPPCRGNAQAAARSRPTPVHPCAGEWSSAPAAALARAGVSWPCGCDFQAKCQKQNKCSNRTRTCPRVLCDWDGEPRLPRLRLRCGRRRASEHNLRQLRPRLAHCVWGDGRLPSVNRLLFHLVLPYL